MIAAADALRLLSAHREDALVVVTMSTGRLWPSVSTRPDLDLPISNCMGKASSVALGVALARPDLCVWVLDGDGSLVMNLGTLVTIGHAQPKNLIHFVFNDAAYTTVGGAPVPGAERIDFAAMASAAGYRQARQFDHHADLAAQLPDLLHSDGPALYALRIAHWRGLADFGPMTQQVMDSRLITAAAKYWHVRQVLNPGTASPFAAAG
jgi:phosphonopyruvate decarboxylase